MSEHDAMPPASPDPAMPAPTGRARFSRELLAALPMWLYGIVLLALSSLHAFEEAEKKAAELQARLFQPTGERVAQVKINERDYQTLFGARSPLDAAKLGALVEKIAAGRPSVIAVDIDTSDASFMPLRALRCDCRLVWARDARAQRDGPPAPGGVLGANDDEAAKLGALVVLYEDASDKVTRRYAQVMNTAAGPLETFGSRVARLHAPDQRTEAPDRRARVIRFSDSARFEIPSGVVMADGFEWQDRIRGRIVLVGGTYDRDRHDTPLGAMDGVDILANVVETELAGGGETRPHWLGIVLLGALEAILLVALFHRFRPLVAVLASVLVVVVLAALLGLAGALVYWPYSVGVLIGVLLHEVKRRTKVNEHLVVETAAKMLVERVGKSGATKGH